MRVLLPTDAHASDFAFAHELCRALEKDGVQFVVAVTGGPLQPHQRASMRMLSNARFVESTYRPVYADSRNLETQRTLSWLRDVANEFDVDVVHAANPMIATYSWGRPAAYARQRILIGRSEGTFYPRHKELLIAASDAFSVAPVASALGWPVFVLSNAPASDRVASLTNLNFLGELSPEDAGAVLGRASIFVHTCPNAGYSVLDAALCGCALILVESAETLAQWRGAAVFLSDGEPERLQRALDWLMNDADARTDFGQRARALALNYTSERMAAAYLTLYIESALTTGRPLASHS